MTNTATGIAAGEPRQAPAHTKRARIALAAIMLATTASVSAHTEYSESGSLHWLDHAWAISSQPTERQLAPYGYDAPCAAADRTIVVGKGTRHLNVVQLETVAIRVGDKTVNWTFDALPKRSFPLSAIIPGAEGVTVHVAESPLYSGH